MALPGEQERYELMGVRQSRGMGGPLPGWLGGRGHLSTQAYSAMHYQGVPTYQYPTQNVPQPTPGPAVQPQPAPRTVVRYISPGLQPTGMGVPGPVIMPAPSAGMRMPFPMQAPPMMYPYPGAGRLRATTAFPAFDEHKDFDALQRAVSSRKLLFWPKSALMAYVTSGTSQTVWTRFLSTEAFLEVAVHLEVDAELGPNSTITVTPEVSSDATVWDSLSSFTAITPGGAYPKTEVIKCDKVAAFMRFRITLSLSSGSALSGATIGIFAVGKPED